LLRTWFPRFITHYRSAHAAMPRRRRITDAELARAYASRAQAVRNPWSRAAWIRSSGGATLFVAGTDHACSIAFARAVSSREPLLLASITNRGDRDALRNLIDLGHVTLSPTGRSAR
jgi:ribosomal protein L16 Arg81 hydroxylase